MDESLCPGANSNKYVHGLVQKFHKGIDYVSKDLDYILGYIWIQE